MHLHSETLEGSLDLISFSSEALISFFPSGRNVWFRFLTEEKLRYNLKASL